MNQEKGICNYCNQCEATETTAEYSYVNHEHDFDLMACETCWNSIPREFEAALDFIFSCAMPCVSDPVDMVSVCRPED